MDKLELDLNDLEVDSFQTNPEQEDERGTVQGNLKASDVAGCSDFCETQPYCEPVSLDCTDTLDLNACNDTEYGCITGWDACGDTFGC